MGMGVSTLWGRPTDSLVTVSRPVPAFSRIVIQDGVDVVFATGDYACSITCKPGNDAYVVTTVSKSVLTIQLSAVKIGTTVYLSAPSLEMVEVQVAGRFRAETPIRGEELLFELKGTASIQTCGIQARKITVRQYGTTLFRDLGTLSAHTVEAALYGVGNMQFHAMQAQHTQLSIKGSGMLRVTDSLASSMIDLSVNGLGSIQCDDVDAGTTKAELKGAGLIRLAGKTAQLQSKVAGIGNLNTDFLKVG